MIWLILTLASGGEQTISLPFNTVQDCERTGRYMVEHMASIDDFRCES